MFKALLASLIFLSSSVSFAATATSDLNQDPMVAHARVEPYEIGPGESGRLLIDLQLPEQFHAYLDQFKVSAEQPENLKIGNIKVDPVSKFYDKFSKREREGVHVKALLSAPLEIPENISAGESDLKVKLTYQACADSFCLFPKTQIVSALVKIKGPATTSSRNSPSIIGETFKEVLNRGWFATYLFVFIAGILTSFTPCIFPMIPITLTILGKGSAKRSRSRNFLLSLSYVLGIAMTYSILGLIAASTGALFGAAFNQPWIQGLMAFMFFLLALSMFGFFELQAPAFIRNKFGQGANNTGFVGAFVTGLFAGLVASPCVGPVLVGILTFVAQTQDLLQGFGLLFVFAFGMGQLFIFLGLTSEVGKVLPKSGPWMNTVKYFFGTLMLAVSLYYASLALPFKVSSFTESNTSTEGTQAVKLDWQKYSNQALQKAAQENTPVIIDFSAEWCLACKELESDTFTDAAVRELSRSFVLLKFDATEESAELDVLKKKYNILGLPTILFFDRKGQWNTDQTLTGFEKAPEFLKRMQSVM